MAFNRRLIFWLIKAYIKKWRKTILVFFLLGLGFFFVLRFFLLSVITKIPLIHKEVIGMVGAYTPDTLPNIVLENLSRGLTSVDDNGQVKPDLASSWEVTDLGKAYIFHLKRGLSFTDGTPFTSSQIRYSFSDVKIQRPDAYTVVFRLKETYAPFPIAISRPIFLSGLTGIGKNKIKDIKLNGTFVTSISMVSIDNPFQITSYQFYPTQESLKIAYVLGNISKASGLTNLSFQDTSLDKFQNTVLNKETNYGQLVTIFYNTQDKALSDKRLRDALSYALPNSFQEGERASSPYSPLSWAFQISTIRTQDFDHARLLLKDIQSQNKTELPFITISVLPEYQEVYKEISENWKKVGVATKMKIVSSVPDNFNYEIFLGSFNVPKDPDQYSLWHSDQQNNITGYKNVRIDKLLEDGRKTLNQSDRLKIYADFQKYLQDDQPASFLYFPYTYSVQRK